MFSKINSFYFRPCFTCSVVGSSKSGKTEFVRDFIKDWHHTVPNSKISRLSIFYDTWQSNYDSIIDSLDSSVMIETQCTLPNTNDELHLSDECQVGEYRGHVTRSVCRLGSDVVQDDSVHVVIVDDLIQGQRRNAFLTALFSVLSHHARICAFVITQQLHNNTDLNRSLVRNSEHIIVCKSAVATGTLRALQSQFFSGQDHYLIDSYRKTVARGGRYVAIDLTASSRDNQRVKYGLLSGEVGPMY